MKKIKQVWVFSLALVLQVATLSMGQIPTGSVVVRPLEIYDVLNNPGIGFTTFQRFNGDELNEGEGWTEGFPIEYQDFDGNLTNKGYPQTSIAYFRVYWKFVEPEKGKYNWDMIDKAMATAASRGQQLMLRIAPHGTGPERDVPAWYRELVGPQKEWKYGSDVNGWVVDPEDPRYVQYFEGMIAALGKRYDGHPTLNAVDLSFIGAWGEGAGSELLSETWLPGDNVYNDAVFIPMDMEPGEYAVQLALVDRFTNKPKVLLAIKGKDAEGWYKMAYVPYPIFSMIRCAALTS